MAKGSVRLVSNMFFLYNLKKISKLSKYYYIFVISFIRVFFPIVKNIKIQNYCTKVTSLVDYFFEIKVKDIFLFFTLLSKSLIYRYEQLINMTCVDNLDRSILNEKINRFSLIYLLSGINSTSRLFISVEFPTETILKSISSIYKSATWLEREIYDLFGVFFLKHNDLRRILTDYGFKGFPLRRDFPLTGYIELRYNEELKSVKYKRLKLMQEYRFFNLESPWKQRSNLQKIYEIF